MILGLCGSPRAMTTEYVLRAALDMLRGKGYETVFWGVRGMRSMKLTVRRLMEYMEERA